MKNPDIDLSSINFLGHAWIFNTSGPISWRWTNRCRVFQTRKPTMKACGQSVLKQPTVLLTRGVYSKLNIKLEPGTGRDFAWNSQKISIYKSVAWLLPTHTGKRRFLLCCFRFSVARLRFFFFDAINLVFFHQVSRYLRHRLRPPPATAKVYLRSPQSWGEIRECTCLRRHDSQFTHRSSAASRYVSKVQ